MATNSRGSQTRDGLLNAAIDALNLLKISKATPAKAVSGSVLALLATIRVRSLLFFGDGFLTRIYSGLDGQRTGIRRSCTVLRRYLWSS